jgi:hypothetical protein
MTKQQQQQQLKCKNREVQALFGEAVCMHLFLVFSGLTLECRCLLEEIAVN